MTQRPVAIGLLLCENVIVEEGTRNVHGAGSFVVTLYADKEMIAQRKLRVDLKGETP